MKHMKNLFVAILIIAIFQMATVVGASLQPHQIADSVMPSVTLLVTLDSDGEPIGFGSGFIIADGIVVTNLHVVEGGKYVFAQLVNEERLFGGTRSLLAYSKKYDLAVLSIDGLSGPPIAFGDSNVLRIGDSVYAIGNPQGLTGTFSVGNVSAKRKIKGITYIQMTAPISPGSSGGPVVDSNGQLVAIATLVHKEGGNLNFAVPVSYLKRLLEDANVKIFSKQRKPQEYHEDKSAHVQPKNGTKIAQKPTLKRWFGKPKGDHTLEPERTDRQTKAPLKKNKKGHQPLIIGDTRTDVYYWPWCSGYKDVPTKHRTKFRSSSQAEQAGFERSNSCPRISVVK